MSGGTVRGDAEPEATGGKKLEQPFVQAVAGLTDGHLTYPPPFDLAASAALAANIDKGAIAEKLFEITALRQAGFHVVISAIAPDSPELPEREVINTSVAGWHALTALLEDFIDELCDRLEQLD